ncbi:hypothetical protein CQ12_19730 [Bradyrhizobium jicamae]|uniref:Uncharacterized protein n=1 Tax=Bradyrhizobium jicamae TaxID=280332 RepID=A0A0R3LRR6_9BRAD|nr:hypothetical protein [Bradyrhizobium jicamae]KRR10695.1 hypothetical protein CQ12_19730 [Bradyrhizobium jicamae]
MADKPNQDFGKRNKVSVPAAPRPVPPPPAKRSGHVALLLMGTFAVGSAAYTLMPSRSCEQPSNAYGSPTQTTTECSSRSSSSSSGGGSGGGSSGRSSYYSSDSSSSSSSHSSYDSGSHAAQRGGFGSFGHAIGFSGG